MFKTDIATVINRLVDDVWRPGHISSDKVLFVTILLEVGIDHQSEPEARKWLHLMYQAGSSYVWVGSQISDSAFLSDHRVWDFRSHHDSCWRSDGTQKVISDLYFEMCKTSFPEHAPIELHTVAHVEHFRVRTIEDISHTKNGKIEIVFAK